MHLIIWALGYSHHRQVLIHFWISVGSTPLFCIPYIGSHLADVVYRVLPHWGVYCWSNSLGVPLLILYLCRDFFVDSLLLSPHHSFRKSSSTHFEVSLWWPLDSSAAPLQKWLAPHFNTRLQHLFIKLSSFFLIFYKYYIIFFRKFQIFNCPFTLQSGLTCSPSRLWGRTSCPSTCGENLWWGRQSGGPSEDRTRALPLARRMLSQLSYRPKWCTPKFIMRIGEHSYRRNDILLRFFLF